MYFKEVFELEPELRSVKYFYNEVIENFICVDDIAVVMKSNSLLTEKSGRGISY